MKTKIFIGMMLSLIFSYSAFAQTDMLPTYQKKISTFGTAQLILEFQAQNTAMVASCASGELVSWFPISSFIQSEYDEKHFSQTEDAGASKYDDPLKREHYYYGLADQKSDGKIIAYLADLITGDKPGEDAIAHGRNEYIMSHLSESPCGRSKLRALADIVELGKRHEIQALQEKLNSGVKQVKAKACELEEDLFIKVIAPLFGIGY